MLSAKELVNDNNQKGFDRHCVVFESTVLTTRLQATDADRADSRNGTVTYRIDRASPWANNFSINTETGRIDPVSPGLDRDLMETDYVILTVFARDGGFPPLQTKATVIVVVNVSSKVISSHN